MNVVEVILIILNWRVFLVQDGWQLSRCHVQRVNCLLDWKAVFHVFMLKSWVVPKLCLSKCGTYQSPNPAPY